MKVLLYSVVAVVAGFVAVGFPAAVSAQESVRHSVSNDGKTVTWIIDQPNVNRSVSRYTAIRFAPGDVVTIEAGGCAQTGGAGATWKRYVDPQGPESDQKYHGLIKIPGITEQAPVSPGAGGAGKDGLVRFQDLMPRVHKGVARHTFTIGELRGVALEDRYLRLGYEDSNYGDNGYWGRDNGTGNQCAGLPDAYVKITIKSKHQQAVVPADKMVKPTDSKLPLPATTDKEKRP